MNPRKIDSERIKKRKYFDIMDFIYIRKQYTQLDPTCLLSQNISSILDLSPSYDEPKRIPYE